MLRPSTLDVVVGRGTPEPLHGCTAPDWKMLGFKLRNDRLTVEPCTRTWPGYEITYRRGKTVYHVKVENPNGVSVGVESIELDGRLLLLNEVPLQADGTSHEIRLS